MSNKHLECCSVCHEFTRLWFQGFTIFDSKGEPVDQLKLCPRCMGVGPRQVRGHYYPGLSQDEDLDDGGELP